MVICVFMTLLDSGCVRGGAVKGCANSDPELERSFLSVDNDVEGGLFDEGIVTDDAGLIILFGEGGDGARLVGT